ncbi:hypothetical protein [Peribacillus sp. NPDC060253]|uniref:hypothetical protein n=1 Tax=Peribacillus sp. NPDC060253 TaxID=3347084 RepID=UPI0036541793
MSFDHLLVNFVDLLVSFALLLVNFTTLLVSFAFLLVSKLKPLHFAYLVTLFYKTLFIFIILPIVYGSYQPFPLYFSRILPLLVSFDHLLVNFVDLLVSSTTLLVSFALLLVNKLKPPPFAYLVTLFL